MVKAQRRKGDRLDAMLAAIEDDADHWLQVALYAASVGDEEAEAMCLARLSRLASVCEMQATGA